MAKERSHHIQNYYAMTGAMARLGMERKVKTGIYPLRLPIGYMRRLIDGVEQIEVDPETAPLVRIAFELVAKKGSSLNQVLDVILEKGLAGQSGAPITRSALYRLLTNEFYIGSLRWKGERLRGTHPRLVRYEKFAAAQSALALRCKERADQTKKDGQGGNPARVTRSTGDLYNEELAHLD